MARADPKGRRYGQNHVFTRTVVPTALGKTRVHTAKMSSADRSAPRKPQSRHAVITGASGGLGAALAFELARSGAMLTLTGRDRDRLEATARSCRQSGASDVVAQVCDVRDEAAMADALKAAQERQSVDLIIANAGIGGRAVIGTHGAEPARLAHDVMSTNVLGVVNTVTPLLADFVSRGHGQIAIISSVAGLQALAESPAYCASKAAVRIYGEGLRRRLAADGVRISVFTAGFIDTPMAQSLPFARPFTVSAEWAARRICRGIEQGIAEDIFPWQMRIYSRVLSTLPRPATDLILRFGARLMTNK